MNIKTIAFSLFSFALGATFFPAQVRPEEQGNVLKAKDGNIYSSKIMLDGKRWTTQNLNIKVKGSYCYDDKEVNCGRYGRLYTWEAAKNACNMLGDGWRLPIDDEWQKMAKQYGGVHDDSGETGKSAYKALLTGGNSGFDAVLGGNRDSDGKYSRLEAHGFYWSATKRDTAEVPFFNFGRGSQALYRQSDGDSLRAFSVRCIKGHLAFTPLSGMRGLRSELNSGQIENC